LGKETYLAKIIPKPIRRGRTEILPEKKRPPYEEENKDCRFFRLGVEEIAVDESGAFGRTEAR